MHHAKIVLKNFAFMIETLHFLKLATIIMKFFAHLLQKRQKTCSSRKIALNFLHYEEKL